MPATDGTWRASHFVDARPALIASILVALGLGIFLVIRRASGALVEPIPPVPLAAAAILALAWSASVRLLLRDSTAVVWKRSPTVALALFAIALSFPAHRALDWLIWLPVFMLNAIAPAMVFPLPAPGRGRGRGAPPIGQPSTVLQNFTRSRTTYGEEIIEGTLLAEFGPEERAVVLHVAFCPPFELLPHVEVEILDTADATCRVSQVLHNGARLEIRRSAPFDARTAISIGLFATQVADE
jgi:hypothetical protein